VIVRNMEPAMRYAVRALLVAAAASIAIAQTDVALAQSSQTVQPAPQPTLLPQSSTSTACLVACDTVAMNCANACVVVGPVTTTTTAASPATCNLNCTSIQLVCKQGCTR
jgi:hypothetical protein